MKRRLAALALAGILMGCVAGPTPAPVKRVYTPRFQTIAFDFMERYRVSHDYLIGPGIAQCRYDSFKVWDRMEEGYRVVYRSDFGAFVERDGLPYQWANGMDYKPRLFPMRGYLVGGARKSNLGGVEYRYWEFIPLCSDWVGSHAYNWQIRKSSSLSIEQSIQAMKDLLDQHWTKTSRWERESLIARDGKRWMVFRSWNRATYLADAHEEWYLPIGDSGYYVYTSFGYKSGEPAEAPEQYARARAAFDHIIDSVKIEPLK